MSEPLTREQVESYLSQAARDSRLSFNMAEWCLHHDAALRAKLAACEQERDALIQAGQP